MRSASSWIGKRGTAAWLVLLVAVLSAVACAPAAPSSAPPAEGPRPAAPPKVVRVDNRKENTAGISIFATNNASQRETT